MDPGLLWGWALWGGHPRSPKKDIALREQERLPALGQWLIRVSLTATKPEPLSFLRLVKPPFSPLIFSFIASPW